MVLHTDSAAAAVDVPPHRLDSRRVDAGRHRKRDRLQNAPRHGQEVGHEQELETRQGGPHLGKVAMVVAEPVGPEIADHLREKELTVGRTSSPGDAGRGVHHDRAGSVHQASPHEWQQR